MKIFITGCAKSGTTLMRRLFNAYNLKVAVEEMSLQQFIASDYDVAKRNASSIFSNVLTASQQEEQRKLILDNDIRIVNLTRRREDVLRSERGYVTEARYQSCVTQFYKHRDLIDVNIEFEKLISSPDEMQWKLSNKFGLNNEFMFSDYPKFIDESKEKFTKNNYKLRKLGEGYDMDNK